LSHDILTATKDASVGWFALDRHYSNGHGHFIAFLAWKTRGAQAKCFFHTWWFKAGYNIICRIAI